MRELPLETVHRLFITTFNRQELKILLRVRLRVKLFDIASPVADDSAMCLSMMEWFEKRGRLGELVRTAAAERPKIAQWQRVAGLVPVPVDEVFVETHRLLVQCFNRDDLTRLLLFKLNERLGTIATPDLDLTATTFEIVEHFEQRGRLCDLFCAAAADRRQIDEWQTLRESHCAGPAGSIPARL